MTRVSYAKRSVGVSNSGLCAGVRGVHRLVERDVVRRRRREVGDAHARAGPCRARAATPEIAEDVDVLEHHVGRCGTTSLQFLRRRIGDRRAHQAEVAAACRWCGCRTRRRGGRRSTRGRRARPMTRESPVGLGRPAARALSVVSLLARDQHDERLAARVADAEVEQLVLLLVDQRSRRVAQLVAVSR